MDDLVKAALLKWPNVPACTGWLALDARGDWYMRDDRIQARGPFPAVKGSRIEHDKLREFIHRNYDCDAQGAWFFQNGPQRVYVELEAAPWVLGVVAGPNAGSGAESGTASGARPEVWRVETHTGRHVTQVQAVWLDESGRLFLDTELGLGIVRSMDMGVAADAVTAGDWQPRDCHFADLVRAHRLCLSPQAAQSKTGP